MPESNQEFLLVVDILSLLHGGRAAHFATKIERSKNVMLSFRKSDFFWRKFSQNLAKYVINEHCDPSLKSLTADPLQLVHCLGMELLFTTAKLQF